MTDNLDSAANANPSPTRGVEVELTSFQIREIDDSDVAEVAELWRTSGISRPWNDPLNDIAFARRSPQNVILVGEIGRRIVTTAMVGEDGHRGWVYYVATHPDMQRRGLARRMMQAAETWLQGRGIWRMQLLVRAENVAAHGFYEKLGFGDTRTTCFQKVIAGDPNAGDVR